MIVFIVLLIVEAGCNDGGGKVEDAEKKEPVSETLLHLDERFKATDSVVFVFYKDPYGKDSLRYTRYYTQISLTEPSVLDLLREQVMQKATRLEKYRNCRGEGKVWCFANGKIFQTIYFSTRCADCCHVFLIKDGFFYYVPILKSFITQLDSIKPLSKDP